MIINLCYFFLLSILNLIDCTYFQQNSYRIKNDFLKSIKKNRIFRLLLFLFSVLIIIFNKAYMNYSISAICIIYSLFLLKSFKVRLKFTKRILRLLTTVLLISIILLVFKASFYIFPVSFLIIYLAAIINYPLEKMIYRSYVKKCRKEIKDFTGLKIGITGSYGKTSVKHFLYQILKLNYQIYYTEKSFNTPMGICKSVIGRINNLYDIMIFEMGAAKKGDIKELMELCDIDIAILNNIGPQHLKTFKDMKNIIEEKFQIVNMLKENGMAFVNVANSYIAEKIDGIERKISTFGDRLGDYRLEIKEISEKGMSFNVYKKDALFDSYQTEILGEHNAFNILACISVADYLKMDKSKIKEGIKGLKGVKNRFEIKKYNNYTIIDDGFNSNINGANMALDLLKNFEGEKWIITPGFVDLGKKSRIHHEIFSKQINERCDYVIIVNKLNRKYFQKYLSGKNVFYQDSFMAGMNLFYQMTKGKKAVLLIENDLPDNY